MSSGREEFISPNQVAVIDASATPSPGHQGDTRPGTKAEEQPDDDPFLPPRIRRMNELLPTMFANDEQGTSPLNLTININTKPRRSVSDSYLIEFKPNNASDSESIASCDLSADDVSGGIKNKKRQKKKKNMNKSRNLLRRLSSLLHRRDHKASSSSSTYLQMSTSSSIHAKPQNERIQFDPSELLQSKSIDRDTNVEYECEVTSPKKFLSGSPLTSGYPLSDVPTMQSMSSISFSQDSKNCNSILEHNDHDITATKDKLYKKNGSKSSKKTLGTISTRSTGFLLTCMDSAIDTFSEGVSCCKSSVRER